MRKTARYKADGWVLNFIEDFADFACILNIEGLKPLLLDPKYKYDAIPLRLSPAIRVSGQRLAPSELRDNDINFLSAFTQPLLCIQPQQPSVFITSL